MAALQSLATKFYPRKSLFFRRFSSGSCNMKKALILGAYQKKKDEGEGVIFTPTAKNYNISTKSKLNELINLAGPGLKAGKSRIFYGIDEEFSAVAVVGLGAQDAGINENEEVDESKENIRIAVADGIRKLRDVGVSQVEVDPCGSACAAAEGASLGLFSYDDLKQESDKNAKISFTLRGNENCAKDWNKGIIMAESQNLAKKLMEMPSNVLTPSQFGHIANVTLSPFGVQTKIREKQWIVDKKMNAFLSVAKGSREPPVFVEISYSGAKENTPPVVLVGKGITFDSGGISLKKPKGMDMMRGDMGGGACTLATIYAVAALRLPINVVGLIPLCENMPGGEASKPGDVVTAMNGTTIQIDDTDYEGRLILADALCYADKFQPLVIVDMATLTLDIMVALGAAASGAYTNSPVMWHHLQKAGIRTGDRVWKMPLFEYYSRQIRPTSLADLNNIGKIHGIAGSCTAAAFLKEFVSAKHWVHLDIASVMLNNGDVPYIGKGLSGRPTRTLIEFVSRLSKNPLPK